MKQIVRRRISYMHKAILDFLYENYREGYGIGPAEIGKKLGIYRDAGIVHMNDAIVTGFLNELYELGKVVRKEQPNGRGGWALTDEGYSSKR